MMKHCRFEPSQRLGGMLAVSLGIVAVADFFFFGRTPGWTLGLFAFVLLGVMGWRYARQFRRGPLAMIMAGVAVLAVSMVFRVGILAPLLAVGLLVAGVLTVRHGRSDNPMEWIRRGVMFVVLGWLTFIRDMIRLGDVCGRRSKVKRSKLHLVGWILPVVLSLVFISFFAAANPVLDTWLVQLGDWLGRLGENLARLIDWLNDWLSPERIVFWAVVFMGAWALLRFRCSLFRKNIIHDLPQPTGGPEAKTRVEYRRGEWPETRGLYTPRVALRCLVLFNIVFLGQTLMDVVYLFGGLELPEGMTHAQYAHRGAYPLIATTLLAAALVLMTFRPGGRVQQMPIARQLVYLWLTQNLFLTLSSLWRLRLYVDAYDLTRLRVASAIWMGLVFGGVALIIWRIVKDHGNHWLIWSNAAMTFGVLYVCALIPWDGWIARYNVSHCREVTGEGITLDVEYLYTLGPEVLPVLASVRTPDFPPEKTQKASQFAAKLSQKLEADLKDWRGWTWQRSNIARRYPERGASVSGEVAEVAGVTSVGNHSGREGEARE